MKETRMLIGKFEFKPQKETNLDMAWALLTLRDSFSYGMPDRSRPLTQYDVVLFFVLLFFFFHATLNKPLTAKTISVLCS